MRSFTTYKFITPDTFLLQQLCSIGHFSCRRIVGFSRRLPLYVCFRNLWSCLIEHDARPSGIDLSFSSHKARILPHNCAFSRRSAKSVFFFCVPTRPPCWKLCCRFSAASAQRSEAQSRCISRREKCLCDTLCYTCEQWGRKYCFYLKTLSSIHVQYV